MISIGSFLYVLDNSGARYVQCIGMQGSCRQGAIGCIITVVVKKAVSRKKKVKKLKVQQGVISRAVIVQTAKELLRWNGSYIRFGANCVILLDRDFSLLSTRIVGPVSLELRFHNLSRILSVSTLVI